MRAFHLLLVLALLTLSGCQNGTPTPPPVTATGAATATVAAASPTSPPESVFAVTPDALRGLTIEVWHPWTGAMGHLLEIRSAHLIFKIPGAFRSADALFPASVSYRRRYGKA
jgi:hypothetical protein